MRGATPQPQNKAGEFSRLFGGRENEEEEEEEDEDVGVKMKKKKKKKKKRWCRYIVCVCVQ